MTSRQLREFFDCNKFSSVCRDELVRRSIATRIKPAKIAGNLPVFSYQLALKDASKVDLKA